METNISIVVNLQVGVFKARYEFVGDIGDMQYPFETSPRLVELENRCSVVTLKPRDAALKSLAKEFDGYVYWTILSRIAPERTHRVLASVFNVGTPRVAILLGAVAAIYESELIAMNKAERGKTQISRVVEIVREREIPSVHARRL